MILFLDLKNKFYQQSVKEKRRIRAQFWGELELGFEVAWELDTGITQSRTAKYHLRFLSPEAAIDLY